MRYISWLSGFFLFLLALGFAVKNSDLIVVSYYLGYQWQAPKSLVILAFFCAGAVVGVAASMSFLFRQKREILSLKRELRAKTQSHESKGG
jgi:lipopolysaccharide assembly protein A